MTNRTLIDPENNNKAREELFKKDTLFVRVLVVRRPV